MNGREAAGAALAYGGRAVAVKFGAAGVVLLLVFLVVLGMFGAGAGGGTAHADSCGHRGTPGRDIDTGADADDYADIRDDQINNAKTINRVAGEHGLPGRATLVALMAALQESTLLNLPRGHADSVGLFQQRPSQGWGTKEQLLDPQFASEAFFLGGDGGDPKGLTDVEGWQKMPLGDAAQAVQRSAYPDLYAGEEDAARDIAREAGIDLGRAGDVDQTRSEDSGSSCYPHEPGKPGEPFHDGEADWPAKVHNPRSTADALAWARREAETGGKDWYRWCLRFVASAYGWTYAGVHTAADHYRQMPAAMQHHKDRKPPPGALMYWDTGQRAGHVAVYLGNGKIASNDIERPGYIDIAPATAPETTWGATYLGWAPPYFPKGG